MKLKTDMAWPTIVRSILPVYRDLAPAPGREETPADRTFTGRAPAAGKER